MRGFNFFLSGTPSPPKKGPNYSEILIICYNLKTNQYFFTKFEKNELWNLTETSYTFTNPPLLFKHPPPPQKKDRIIVKFWLFALT